MRKILVTGSTGKQGRSFIRAALATEAQNDIEFLALTRHLSSPAASSLASLSERVILTEGDLNDPESIKRVFQSVEGGVWGVFVVLAYPGLGKEADDEERQGRLLIDLSVEFKVSHFVFSSHERGGESYDDNLTLDRLVKVKLERYLRSQADLPWTILRPGFFMENFDGFLGKIAASVIKYGVDSDVKLDLISSEDIGAIANAVFLDPKAHISDIIVVVGDVLTASQRDESYKRASGGKNLPGIPALMAKAIIAMNKHTQNLMEDITRNNRLRVAMEANGEESREDILAKCRTLYPGMLTFEEWSRRRIAQGEPEKTGTANWNNLSFVKLVTGKS